LTPDDTLASAIDLLGHLIAFPSISDASNLPLADYVEDYLKALGVSVLRAPNAAGDKTALLATIGPMVDGGVILSGHVDVVPAVGQKWTSDPFRMRRDEGLLYGRGACDMKGFDAVALAMAPHFLSAGLRRPIHILLSYDEELTCLGPLDFIRRFGVDLPRPAVAIVGEPSMMMVVDSHKGVASFTTRVTGVEAHSAKPATGANAVPIACEIVAKIDRLSREREDSEPRNPRFDPPWSTLHVGTIHGGEARNILARECVAHWEFRAMPGVDSMEPLREVEKYIADVALPRLTRHVSGPTITTRVDVDVPPLAAEAGSLAENLALSLTRTNATHAVSYASEAGHFQRAGIPTIICGPGSIDQAHRPDEYIAVEQMAACVAFMEGLARELAS
jgi:acetylornithine deacetylase